jgi:putative addiction module component (TIGR02574 family)
MTATATAPASVDLSAILELPVQDRIEIAHIILDSIAADTPRPPLSEEFKQELRRRRDEARANPGDDIPWEEIKAASLARCQQ